MEIDFIFLKKEKAETDSSLKELVLELLGKIFVEVDGKIYYEDEKKQRQEICYQLSEKNNNLYLKVSCVYSEMKSAEILDRVRSALQKGPHKARLNAILIYDEVSQVYCCKLMHYFGIFERRLRQLMYLTLIKAFGINWYEESFTKAMKDNLLAKTHGQKEMLVEGALNELAYEELKTYLFEPYSTMDNILENELAKDNLQDMSKEQLIKYINMGRSRSIWDRFFSNIKGLENMQERINYLQPNRNKVMHHKTLSKQEFLELRKTLNEVNSKLEIAVVNIENRIYTEDDLKQVLSAIGRTLVNGLGSVVEKWRDSVRPFLSALGQITMEAMRHKYDVNMLMPTTVSSEALTSARMAAKRWADIVNLDISGAIMQELGESAKNFAALSAALPSKDSVDNMNMAASTFAETIRPLQVDNSVLQKLQEQEELFLNLIPSERLVTAYESAQRAYEAMSPKMESDDNEQKDSEND